MANFLKSLFKGKSGEQNSEENNKDKSISKNFDILKYDGIRAQRMGRTDYAILCYTKALELEKDFEVMNYLSQIYAQTDELDEARDLLEQMIGMEPQIITTYLVLANVLFLQESYDEMVNTLKKAIAIDENNANAHYLSAKAQKHLEEYTIAIQHLTKAIGVREDFIEAILMRAEIHLQQKDFDKAMTDIDKALQIQADEEHALLLRGKLNEYMEHTQEAERDYRLVIELNPFHDQAFIYLAQLYIAQEKIKEAIELCNDAIELNPNSAELYHERGKAKSINGDREGSEEDMKQAELMMAELHPQQPRQQEEKQGNSLGLPFS